MHRGLVLFDWSALTGGDSVTDLIADAEDTRLFMKTGVSNGDKHRNLLVLASALAC
jgi:hypothetical protein